MSLKPEFKVGDRVTIHDKKGPARITFVTAVEKVGRRKKLKVVLKDGSEWDEDGSCPYGNTDKWYFGPTIKHTTEDDLFTVAHRHFVAKISTFTEWASLSVGDLGEIYNILKKNGFGKPKE